MKIIFAILLILLVHISASSAVFASGSECPPLLDHNVETLGSGENINLCEAYQGQVLLIVNTANKCDLTEQYEALEQLQEKFHRDGLVVLGFHNNDFTGELPGARKTDKEYCRLASSIRFPMIAKQSSHPDKATPLFRLLAGAAGEYPSWNFHKYVVDRNGKLRGSFDSMTDPQDPTVTRLVETLL